MKLCFIWTAIEKVPKSLKGRLLLGPWLVGAWILGSAYQGMLTSLLAVPRVQVPVDSLQDLVDYGRIPWANEYGTSLHQLFGVSCLTSSETIHSDGVAPGKDAPTVSDLALGY